MDTNVGDNPPQSQLIEELMRQCQCTEEEALQSLRRTNNDVAKAKRFYVNRNKYLPSSSTPAKQLHNTNRNSGDYASSSDNSIESSSANTPAEGEHAEAATRSPRIPGTPIEDNEVEDWSNITQSSPIKLSSMNIVQDVAEGDEYLGDQSEVGCAGGGVTINDSTAPPNGQVNETADCPPQGERVRTGLEDLEDWDFSLPDLPPTGNLLPGLADEANDLRCTALAAAIQHNPKTEIIRIYLGGYEPELVMACIKEEAEGFPVLFYAVATCDEDMVRLVLDRGADPSAVHKASQTPVLAFAIVHGEVLQTDTTPIVALLLSYGAIPQSIPTSIYAPYDRDPSPSTRSGEDSKNSNSDEYDLSRWCTGKARSRLSKATNITHRYYLDRASKIKSPSKKKKQVARLRSAERLLGIPYFLVGQSFATELLIQRLLTHLMMPTKRPLVLCFAGPSGHGKTELARQLGHLLSLDLEVVDCTIVNREMELFGPREPYVGAEKGSPVNNFLAEHTGQRCIVFFDEFEKTTREIHQALLLPFDNGEYSDRRNHDKVDCSNTIWIIATNALDNIILEFCQKNDAVFGASQDKKRSLTKQLLRQLQEGFLQHFDAPITGRISEFVPFVPFSSGEQAVITHKALLELADDLRRPVNLSKGPQEQLVGDIRLWIRRDATVCSMLAQAHYHRKLGARSLKAGARKVERIVLDAYLDEDEEIQEKGELRDFVIDVQGDEIIGQIGRKTA